EFGFTGPNSTNARSCASGTIAVGDACHAIRAGRADVMLAGGAEAPLAPMTYAAFSVIRAMSTRNDDPEHASRPFDEDRDGFVMGEGAAVLVLEERARALARGAKIYAEIVGYGFTNDAYHMTAPRPDGSQAARAIRLALAAAHPQPRAPRSRVRPRLPAARRSRRGTRRRRVQLLRLRWHQRHAGVAAPLVRCLDWRRDPIQPAAARGRVRRDGIVRVPGRGQRRDERPHGG